MEAIRRSVGRHAGGLLATLIASAILGWNAWEAMRSEAAKVARPRVVLPDHEAYIEEFAPDGRALLTAGASGACVREAATGRVLVRLMRTGPGGPIPVTEITWPRFTADGRHLIVQSGRSGLSPGRTVTLAVFEVATGRQCATFAEVGPGIWRGSALPPAEYALSADGSTLAFTRGRAPGTGRVTVWDIASEAIVAEFPGAPPLALSPDGGLLAHADARPDVTTPTIRRLKPGAPVAALRRILGASPGLGAGAAAFSLDSTLLAFPIPGATPLLQILDVNRGRVRVVLDPNSPRRNGWFSPEAAWFSPDSRLLFTEDVGGDTDTRRIQFWELSGASPRRVLEAPTESFTPDGSRAAIAKYYYSTFSDGFSDLTVFDLPQPRARFRRIESGVLQATISPDGRFLALPSDRREAPHRRRIIPVVSQIRDLIGLSPRNPFDGGPVVEVHEIKICDAATGQMLGTIDRSARPRPPGSVTFSPDGKTLVVKDFPADFHRDSGNPPIDWSVALWDVPAAGRGGAISWPAAVLSAAVLLFIGIWLDRRRARRVPA